jgi:hypothetical protein
MSAVAVRSILLAFALIGCSTPPGDDAADDGADDDASEPPGGIAWRTPRVLFKAQRFRIDAGGDTFFGRVADPRVHTDWSTPDYQTLEVTWLELGVEMRVNIYFYSDGTEWWSNEVRTYDGAVLGDWITYTGDLLRAPLGQPFTEDLELSSGSNALTVRGLHVEPFLPPLCDGSPYSLEPYDPVVWLPPVFDDSQVYCTQRVFAWDAMCAETDAPPGSTMAWTIDDPSIATIGPDPEVPLAARVYPVALGETIAHGVLHAADGAELAATQFTVHVRPYP